MTRPKQLPSADKDSDSVLPTVEHLSLDEAKEIIRSTISDRQFDPNFDSVS